MSRAETGMDGLAEARRRIAVCKETQNEELYLGNIPVSDLGLLSGLTHLKSLDLEETQISDLGPLSKLTKLTSLNLSFNLEIVDLGPLSELTQLTSLNLFNTGVCDLCPLSGLTQLTSLNLWSAQISDLKPLSRLTQLTSLNIGFTEVRDLGPISELTQLTFLDLGYTGVRDLGPISGLAQLSSLNLGGRELNADFRNIWFMKALNDVKLEKASVPGVPAEILSKHHNDNCLPRLRAYFTDLEKGTEPVRDTKLIILGNGRVGKTQICRRLQSKDYDDTIPSTHGIQIATAPLGDDEDKKRLQIWDFGGQDIYHGTHSLFLKSRAVFVIVWTPDMEEEREHEYEDYIFRNEPLPYWVNYVRQAAGQDAPMLIVQTRVDDAEVEVEYQPVDKKRLEGFRFRPRVLQYSAKTDFNRAALDDALKLAADWLREQRGGATVIGKGWAKVKHKLESMRDRDQQKEPGKRKNRTIAYQKFCEICKKTGGVIDPDVLLGYLHDTGIVFYQEDMFGNEIILDQQWALEAIYTVLERKKSYRRLLRQHGCFTLSDLGDYLWNETYSKPEQTLFLNMMQSCGICFMHRPADEENEIEAEYIAPDLLPEEPNQLAQTIRAEKSGVAMMEFRFDHLMPGLMRGIISEIGQEAQLKAEYWRSGVLVYEKNTDSYGTIEQIPDPEGWSGSIQVRTWHGQTDKLLEELVRIVERHERKFNITSRRDEFLDKQRIQRPHMPDEEGKTTLKPDYQQAPSGKTEYFVSYGMNNEEYPHIETDVDRFYEKAKEQNVKVVRDRTDLKLRDNIPKFMERVGAGERVIVFMSEKYLKSESCMYELYEMWRTSEQRGKTFLDRVVVYGIDKTDYRSLESQIKWAEHWENRYNKLKPKVHYLSREGFQEFKLIEKFYHYLPEILQTAKSVLQPGSFKELCEVVFGGEEEKASMEFTGK